MKRGVILDEQALRKEIEESHRRSNEYGINTEERDPGQVRLSPGELELWRLRKRDFLEVARTHIDEFYDLISPRDFMIAVVDDEGYILHLSGSDEIKAKFAARNCSVGFRWTERDVGTTAISLCLERRIPVQLNDKDHYCKRGHGFTSSAAPVFGEGGNLLGVLVVSGSSELTHPHTLIMIASAARAIEKQLALLHRNESMALHIGFLDSVIESAGTGFLTLDKEMRIWKTNLKARQILKNDQLDGRPAAILEGLNLEIEDVRGNPAAWANRECWLKSNGHSIHLICSAKPVLSHEAAFLGILVSIQEFGDVRKLADNIAGTKAYFTFEDLIGRSPLFLKAVELAKRAVESDSTILLQGETGTGKEIFAQAIHNAGPRRNFAFVPINCGAIPGELLESELFGYVDGAFTGAMRGGRPGKFELASGGTIFLDEIGDMPPNMQVKLLRVLQTGEIQRIGARRAMHTNTRVVAATHIDLAGAVARKQFRQDLFYRLNVLPIAIPSLRERGPEDIRLLAQFFLSRGRKRPPKVTAAAMQALSSHSWPGNVRELENTIQRAIHNQEGDLLDAGHLGLQPSPVKTSVNAGTLKGMEREHILSALEQRKHNMAATAKTLGISRASLYRKLKIYGYGLPEARAVKK
jgi:transcriptional regulator of acetoin/glycerol metabolism